jgi:O-antigen/teichoic acid export membrane protein
MLALFISVTSVVSIIATGRYELAVLLPEKDEDAANVMGLAVIISLAVSALTLVAVLLGGGAIANFLGNPEISRWLYLAPLAVLVTSLYQTLNCWLTRKLMFKMLAFNRISVSATTTAANLSMGAAGMRAGGLIMGSFVGQLVPTAVLCWQVWQEGDQEKLSMINGRALRGQAVRHKNFPLFSLPADFIGVVSNQLPVVLLSNFFGATVIGFYSLTQRVLAAPIALIASSIFEVFKQRASSDFAKFGNCGKIYVNTLKYLLLLSLPPFIIFFFTAPPLFAVVFGAKWRIAGEYAQILSVMYFLRFISSPLSFMYFVAERQKEDLFLRILTGIFTFLYYHRF